MPKATWNDEKILVAGHAGVAKDCDKLNRILKRPGDVLDIAKVWETYTSLADYKHNRSDDDPGFSATLVAITEKNLWILIFKGRSLRSYKEPRNKPYAHGSGSDAAKMAMMILNANAIDAIYAARAIDAGTGGPVKSFNTTTYDPDNTAEDYRYTVHPAMTRDEAIVYVRNGFKPAPQCEEVTGIVTDDTTNK
jgi:hypothetical protein